MHDFGNPFCVPGHVSPKTGTACPTATTGTPPWTTSLFLILETPDVHDFGNPFCVPRPVGPEMGTASLTATTGTSNVKNEE